MNSVRRNWVCTALQPRADPTRGAGAPRHRSLAWGHEHRLTDQTAGPIARALAGCLRPLARAPLPAIGSRIGQITGDCGLAGTTDLLGYTSKSVLAAFVSMPQGSEIRVLFDSDSSGPLLPPHCSQNHQKQRPHPHHFRVRCPPVGRARAADPSSRLRRNRGLARLLPFAASSALDAVFSPASFSACTVAQDPHMHTS